ncbi:GD21990 [Drosophila simulans]|uniref:GD21990 n=1 Tax=Drosophila simulans TaxID=7240 RepID=B4Q5W3_DROSI|nr:GD21990 [Drosophila simulans]
MAKGALTGHYIIPPSLGAIMDAISVRTLCNIFKLVSVPGTFMLNKQPKFFHCLFAFH